MNPQKNNMSVLAQISSWIPDRIPDNLAKKYKIQTRSFSPFSHVLTMVCRTPKDLTAFGNVQKIAHILGSRA